jgi:hypothetical protein
MATQGDRVILGQNLMNVTWLGYVTDLDSPTGVQATMEAIGDEMTISQDVLLGPRGIPGKNAPLVTLLWDAGVTEVGDLPTDWGPDDANKGFWIDDLVYVWTGNQWQPKSPGPAGPRGLTPAFDVSVESISWEAQQAGETSEVIQGGPVANPSLLFRIAAPRGPEGASGRIRQAADYQEPITGPEDLQVLGWNNLDGKYEPRDIQLKMPKFYTVPEAAFTSFSGGATRQQVCAFPIPPQPFDWIPIVTGHIRAVAAQLAWDILVVGAEVRLSNSEAGPLVARGYGNNSTFTTMVPHFSLGGDSMDAASPDNTTGVVPAYHTGNTGTLYVNLYNDGAFGLYDYDRKGSQLGVLVLPV